MTEQANPSSSKGDTTKPEFSVIITCYYEEASIDEFYARLSKTLEGMGRSYEIVFVNDGSTDKTLEKLKSFVDRDANVTCVIDLFRNSGQQAAITAGLVHARGTHYIFIDSDLQLDPEELPLLVAEFDKDLDVVSGYRKDRKDFIFRKIPSKLANMIMRKVSQSNFTDFGCTFKIMHGRLIRGFDFGPYKVFRPPNIIAKAQRCAEIPVTHHVRKHGKSGWTFKRLFAYNMDNIVSLSQRPFQILSVVCLLFALLFFVRIALSWIFDFSILPEITHGLLLNTIVIGLLVTISILCMIGEFVIRNFVVLQRYPTYVIREIYQSDQ
ncbi:MAG: glycosyltransferase family 2 protein [Planctomycetes bacterium]|nr:glycosyltransferase family 2 protein [Planctomycetota bacterium]